jgi:hypothetical protein
MMLTICPHFEHKNNHVVNDKAVMMQYAITGWGGAYLHGEADRVGRPRELPHLVQLRLPDVLHGLLGRGQRRLCLGQLRFHGFAAHPNLLVLTLQLDREFLRETLALLRLVLTGHHLPQFLVRFRVLRLTINGRGYNG